jgi:hypothetical protein
MPNCEVGYQQHTGLRRRLGVFADTREHLENILVVLLSGRAAEQLTFAEVTVWRRVRPKY